MQTTNLFVELLLIGIGAALWIGLLFISVFGIDPNSIVELTAKNQIMWAAIGIAVLYILGILVDRLADLVFDKKNKKIMHRYYENRKQLLIDRTMIYKETSPLVDNIAYGRSRMRICRGWIFNLVWIILFGNIVLAVSGAYYFKHYFLFNFCSLLLMLGFYFAWQNLVKKEYEKVKGIGEILRNKQHLVQ